MKVDRARFLTLTGALSAATGLAFGTMSACSSSNTVMPTQAPDAAGGDSATDGESEATTDAGICLGDAVDAGDAGDASAIECSDGGVAANGCGLVCDNVTTRFKAAIAGDILDCVAKLPTCEGADDAIADCIGKSLAKACPDSTASSFCTPLVGTCTPDGGPDGGDAGDAGADSGVPVFNQSSCEALAKGLSGDGRAAFTTCITEGVAGNCTADPGYCVDSFKH
jgi:hypothetical protein